jgi:hypothetical protein
MKLPTLTEGFLGSLGCVAAIFGIVAAWPFRFSYTSVCSKCGAEQHAQEWKFPGTEMTFFSHASVTATPLSRYLYSGSLVTKHSHDWLFAHGGGNGIRCAIGDGNELWSIIEAPNSAKLLEAMRVYEGPDQARKFLNLALDPAVSRMDPWAMIVAFPTNGFSDGAQYRAWLSENDFRSNEARKNL